MLPSGSWATSYGLAFCRGTVYSVIRPVVWSNFASLPGRLPAAQMPNQTLFWESTPGPRRRFPGWVGGVNSVHWLVVVSNLVRFPTFQRAAHTLSFLSTAWPYGL